MVPDGSLAESTGFRPANQLTSPDSAGVFRDHGLAGLATPGLLEFRHVLQHAVYPITPGRMWIYADQHAGIFGTSLLAPYPAHAEEEALLGRVAVNFFRGLAARILSDGFAQGGQRDAGAAVIGGIFAQCQLAVELQVVYRHKVPVLVGHAAGALLKFLAVLRCPPIAQVASRIELAALIVEAVS